MKEWFNSTNYIIDDIKHENEYCWTFAGLGCNVSHYSDSHKARIGSAYQDLNLLDSLDYTTSSTFLSRKRNLIKKLKDIVDEGIKYGKNKYIWDNNVADYILLKSNEEYFNDPLCKNGYFRGVETFKFVKEVISRGEVYKSKIKH